MNIGFWNSKTPYTELNDLKKRLENHETILKQQGYQTTQQILTDKPESDALKHELKKTLEDLANTIFILDLLKHLGEKYKSEKDNTYYNNNNYPRTKAAIEKILNSFSDENKTQESINSLVSNISNIEELNTLKYHYDRNRYMLFAITMIGMSLIVSSLLISVFTGDISGMLAALTIGFILYIPGAIISPTYNKLKKELKEKIDVEKIDLKTKDNLSIWSISENQKQETDNLISEVESMRTGKNQI